jgi:ABC-type lipoprotein export system ATPase subunit
VVTLLGANGAGKSTTLRAISGLASRPPAKSCSTASRSPASAPKPSCGSAFRHVPEGRRVFPGLTVKENIMLGASNRRRIAKSDLSREADAMFDLFPDIRPFANALGWTLSGGQLQMVAVARGLMAKPRLLLLDEPSLGLAPVIVQAVFRIIGEIRATPRCCWSSRTRAWGCRWPITAMCWKPAASDKASQRNSRRSEGGRVIFSRAPHSGYHCRSRPRPWPSLFCRRRTRC